MVISEKLMKITENVTISDNCKNHRFSSKNHVKYEVYFSLCIFPYNHIRNNLLVLLTVSLSVGDAPLLL